MLLGGFAHFSVRKIGSFDTKKETAPHIFKAFSKKLWSKFRLVFANLI